MSFLSTVTVIIIDIFHLVSVRLNGHLFIPRVTAVLVLIISETSDRTRGGNFLYSFHPCPTSTRTSFATIDKTQGI